MNKRQRKKALTKELKKMTTKDYLLNSLYGKTPSGLTEQDKRRMKAVALTL